MKTRAIGKGGPGKSYRTGMTLMDLFERFPDDATAEAWVVETRWPDGMRCPRCEGVNVARRTHPTMPYHCADCRKFYSAKTGSVMEGSNIGYRKWAIAVYILTTNIKGTSSMKLHRDLGITQKSAWHLAHRIREGWKDYSDVEFAGPVEADETYIGGKEKNKRKNKKLNAGQGAIGKAPVAGVIDRPTNLIKTEVVEATTGKVLKWFVEGNTKDGAQVYTDEAAAYKGINRPHEAVAHSAGEYVRGMAHTNGLESHWALFKRGIDGTFHHLSFKHLQRYASEFSGRHNDRPMDTADQMKVMVEGMVGKRLRYEDLIADEPELGQMEFDLSDWTDLTPGQ